LIEQLVPDQQLGILDQQPPELDEISIARALTGEAGLHELIEFFIRLMAALEIDAALLGRILVLLAETGDAGGGDGLRVARSKRIEQRAVALVEKENAIHVVGFAIVRHKGGPEISHIRIEEAERTGLAAFQIDLEALTDVGDGRTEDIFAG